MDENQSDQQLEALSRILIHVRIFRSDPQNLTEGAYSPRLSHYLKEQLIVQDWEFWQALQLDWEHSK